RVAATNAAAALVMAAIPLLHRVGPLAALIGFTAVSYVNIFVVCSMVGTASGMQMYYLLVAPLGILYAGTDRILFASILGVIAALLIVALEVLVPRTTGLQPDSTMFANFIGTAIASCGILLTIVFYALREAARAEAVAQREHERSESL